MNTNQLLTQLEAADFDDLKEIVKILVKELNAVQNALEKLKSEASKYGIYSQLS